MRSSEQGAAESLLFSLAVLTVAPVQAQITPAIVSESDLQDEWVMSADMVIGSPAFPVTSEADPRIFFITDHDTVFAGIEPLILLLKRETPGNRLTVKVKLEQDREWLADRSREVTFPAGDSLVFLQIPASDFNERVTRSGDLTVTLDDVSGYETASAKATVLVVSTEGPAVTYSLAQPPYAFAENSGRARVQMIARMAIGVPRGVTVGAFLGTRGSEFFGSQMTATAREDFEPVGGSALIVSSKFALEDGQWVGRTDLFVPLLDDDVHEGTETFELNLRPLIDQSDKVQLLNPDGSECGRRCRHIIHITDEEDRPGTVDIEVARSSVAENAGPVSYTVAAMTGGDMEPGTGFSLEVPVRTVGGSAQDEFDFIGVSTQVSFARNDFSRIEIVAGSGDYRWVASKQGKVALVDDEVVEQEEGFTIALGEPTASSSFILGTPGAEVTITNEDRWGFLVEVSPESISEGDEAGVALTLRVVDKTGRVTRDGHCVAPFPVTAAIALRGSASEGRDYTYTVTDGDLSRVRLAGCQPSRRVTLHFVAVRDAESEDDEFVDFTPTLVDTRSADPDPGLHQSASLRIENVSVPVMVSFDRSSYTFGEDAEEAAAEIVARTEPGATGGTAVAFTVSSRSGTAASGDDFRPVSESVTLREQDYAPENGAWVARHHVPLTLFDDDIREGTESLDLILELAPGGSADLQLSNIDGTECRNPCAHPVHITDDEDIPHIAVSVEETNIGEESGASTTVTVSITNGTTFATDQFFTFNFGGTATEGVDYVVTPSDADTATPGHQVILPVGSTSVVVTITAIDDEVEDPDEEFSISVNVGDQTIDGGSVRIRNRPLGPDVEITFEGVEPSHDNHVAGTATGPFETRFTFSEPVDGFSQEDIVWQTHEGTTVDGTSIGVLMWDFTEIRAGLEYTAGMMPTQDGQLYIIVRKGAATSVARGYGNRLGVGSLQIALPDDRLMVAPPTLAVDEGDQRGAEFLIVLTSAPTGTVTVSVNGMEGTEVNADPPTQTVRSPFWNSGRAVKVTAGKDVNTVNETVTLTVSASGGGYDGRTGEVVVTVRDSQASSAGDVSGDADDETAALMLVESVTPEAAAAALLGEKGLSETQLFALDRLGNGNGRYDLGDLLSWIARCRRHEASCGGASPDKANSLPDGAAALAARGHSGHTGHRKSQTSGSRMSGVARRQHIGSGRTSRRRKGRSIRRRWSPARYRLALLLVTAVTLACTDDVVRPPAAADPGYVAVWITAPSEIRDGGAMLLVQGPGIDSLQAPGFEVFQSGTHSSRQVVVSGVLSTGPVMEFRVPDRALVGQYRVQLLQVAGEDYSLRDPSGYSTAIVR